MIDISLKLTIKLLNPLKDTIKILSITINDLIE